MSDELINQLAGLLSTIEFTPAYYPEKMLPLAKQILALISTTSLSQPSEVEVVRKCGYCNGTGVSMRGGECSACIRGEIVRELTEKELLELPKMILEGCVRVIADINTLGYIIQLPSGERVRIKEKS